MKRSNIPGSKGWPEVGPKISPDRHIMLDYPKHGEKVKMPHYTIRVGTLGDIAAVSISIDNRRWLACREAAGYWWYDWSGYAAGRHKVTAKARTKTGRILNSEVREFKVE